MDLFTCSFDSEFLQETHISTVKYFFYKPINKAP